MNETRKEVYTPSFHQLKPIEGFTEGKSYEILSEKPQGGSVLMGMSYRLKDDNGNPRHVNSTYFVLPAVDVKMPAFTNFKELRNKERTFEQEEIDLWMNEKDDDMIKYHKQIGCASGFDDMQKRHSKFIDDRIKSVKSKEQWEQEKASCCKKGKCCKQKTADELSEEHTEILEKLQANVKAREEVRKAEEVTNDNRIWSSSYATEIADDIDLYEERRKNKENEEELGSFGKLVTAEEKLKNTLPVEPHLDMKILCGLRTGNEAAEKNSFVIMEKAIAAMKEQIENLTQIKETLEFELKFLRRMDVIQE